MYVTVHPHAPDKIEIDSWFLNWTVQTSALKQIKAQSLLFSLILDVFLSLLICRLNVFSSSLDTMSTISPTDFDSLEIQQQYNDINNRWDLAAETDWDNENSSARLFERSRIKALAGMLHFRPHQSTVPAWSHHAPTACVSWWPTNMWCFFLFFFKHF